MLAISASDIVKRIQTENPWWEGEHTISPLHREMKPRAYLDLFLPLVKERSVRRAVVLMGPRRVGKTVMIYHAIQALLDEGIRPRSICYLSVDHPIYSGITLEKLLAYYQQGIGTASQSEGVYVFFDEIQYLRDWEVHLKAIVDGEANMKCIASGSAAAALRLKSIESGAGRFTDFLLPPLTFYEYLHLLGKSDLVGRPVQEERPAVHQAASDPGMTPPLMERPAGRQSATEGDPASVILPMDAPDMVETGRQFFEAKDIEELNRQFLFYLNFGGYPEVIFSPSIQADPARFIKSDIIDKVLLRDLPSLYGIADIQELNHLFTALAFNTASEISLGELSKNSGVAKNTIKRYIEYLEAAFLIKVVHRVDCNAKRFRRENFFKVYLTNPSMRAALFSPLQADESAVASLAETSIFSQWFHSDTPLHYARWHGGEVDMVYLGPDQAAHWALEVKWSDRYCDNPEELKSLLRFCRANGLRRPLVTSKTKTVVRELQGIEIEFLPASAYCYTVGYNLIQGRKSAPGPAMAGVSAPSSEPG